MGKKEWSDKDVIIFGILLFVLGFTVSWAIFTPDIRQEQDWACVMEETIDNTWYTFGLNGTGIGENCRVVEYYPYGTFKAECDYTPYKSCVFEGMDCEIVINGWVGYDETMEGARRLSGAPEDSICSFIPEEFSNSKHIRCLRCPVYRDAQTKEECKIWNVCHRNGTEVIDASTIYIIGNYCEYNQTHYLCPTRECKKKLVCGDKKYDLSEVGLK